MARRARERRNSAKRDRKRGGVGGGGTPSPHGTPSPSPLREPKTPAMSIEYEGGTPGTLSSPRFLTLWVLYYS